ncbi:ASCH domain-containing protein [Chryseobacterium sp. SN22]|uniref:ASCH domain-containing protein n=1 Tax=Chryseobacterium sp. SN22 TaxID=2606431 RepID=UPI0011EBFA30|nr:ASCH domain-containing protein [Chryseobacterium sp. SN22]KAA0126468.1 ASCH domain-containing protein [Chryseobacterium sp. SN22]
MNERKELYLILTKEWFLKILSGEKKEEYRDFTDRYIKRLAVTDSKGDLIDVQKYDVIRFQLGYSKKQMIVECRGILVEADNKDDEEFTTDNCNFVIELGEIIEKINCESLNI